MKLCRPRTREWLLNPVEAIAYLRAALDLSVDAYDEAVRHFIEVHAPTKDVGLRWERIDNPERRDIIGVRTMDNGQREFLMHNEALCAPYYTANEGAAPKVVDSKEGQDFAQRWHRVVEIALTVRGLSPALGADEALLALGAPDVKVEEVTEEMDAYGIPEGRQCVCWGTPGCEVCGGSGDLDDVKPKVEEQDGEREQDESEVVHRAGEDVRTQPDVPMPEDAPVGSEAISGAAESANPSGTPTERPLNGESVAYAGKRSDSLSPEEPTAKMEHRLNCASWHNDQGHEVNGEDCTCDLRYRVQEFVEKTKLAELDKIVGIFSAYSYHGSISNQVLHMEAEMLRAQRELAQGSPSEEGTGWIEIKEGCRLPEYGEIVTMINSTTLGGPYQETCDWNLAGDWREAEDAGVTYWKPLDWPAPPVAPPIEEK